MLYQLLIIGPAGYAAQQSGPIALTSDNRLLVNVNPDHQTVTIHDVTSDRPNRKGEVRVGRDPRSVAIHRNGQFAYVANAADGTVSVVNLNQRKVLHTVVVGREPTHCALSPNGSRLYVSNASSNSLSVVNTTVNPPVVLATVDLSSQGTTPGTIGVTDDGDADDTDETVFVAMFFAQLRPGKTSVNEGQDDQREGHVAAISSATNTILGAPSPVVLGPLANSGFNANGRLSPGPGQVPAVPSTNPQTFTTPTGCFPNQLASIAIHPTNGRTYVVSTGPSPNGPFRFNSNAQGLVSLFETSTRLEVTSGQTGAGVRQTAPLNLNQGVNLATTPAPRLFLTNPVAMAWRPDGSDAWIAIQTSDLIVRLTVDASGIPTVGNPLVAGPSSLVRVDLRDAAGGNVPGTAPRGIVINSSGTRAYVWNFTSQSVTVIDISIPASPVIVGSRRAVSSLGNSEVVLGAELFHTGRGPEERMSSEAWGGCIVCHPNGHTDNVTWMFPDGPRQTIALDGMFKRQDFHDQRILNWSAVRDENQDFELNTRGVFGGRGLIEDDRRFFALCGASGPDPLDSRTADLFDQFTGVVSTPTIKDRTKLTQPRFDFGIATLDDGRIFLIGGRENKNGLELVDGDETIIEFNPRTNKVKKRSDRGFTLRHSLGAVGVRTAQGYRIYAVGGYASVDPNAAPVNIVEEFNPDTNRWRTVASLPTGVAQFGITRAGGINTAAPLQLIHVVGGNIGSETTPDVAGNTSPVQRFQPDPLGPGIWSTFSLAGLTLRRNHGIATAIRGASERIFVIGGQDAAGTVLSTVEEYQAQAVTLVATPHTSPAGTSGPIWNRAFAEHQSDLCHGGSRRSRCRPDVDLRVHSRQQWTGGWSPGHAQRDMGDSRESADRPTFVGSEFATRGYQLSDGEERRAGSTAGCYRHLDRP